MMMMMMMPFFLFFALLGVEEKWKRGIGIEGEGRLIVVTVVDGRLGGS